MTISVIATAVAMVLVLTLCVGGVVRLAREAHADLDRGRGGDEVLDRRLAAARATARAAGRRIVRFRTRAVGPLARRTDLGE